MGALMARFDRTLPSVVLAICAAGAGHAAPAVVDAPKSGPPAARIGAINAPTRAAVRPNRAVTTKRSARSATSSAGTAASVAVAPTQSHHVVALSHGNIVGRQVSVPAAIGGPAKYDAKHGAVIGGTVMGRKR
jgi:hypothetical protein